MCGITGFWDTSHRLGGDEGAAVLRSMTCALRHRGPDDDGYFYDEPAGARFRVSSLVHCGHVARGSSADGVAEWPLCDGIQ